MNPKQEQKLFAAGFREDARGNSSLDALGTDLMSEFRQAVLDRRDTEDRWLEDLRQYHGIYSPELAAELNKDSNRSKAFIKKTRTKVKTTAAVMFDLLFPANGDKNFDIAVTPEPTYSEYQIQAATQELMRQRAEQAQQAQAAGQPPAPIEPPSTDEIEAYLLAEAKKRAEAMAATIADQLQENQYKAHAKRAVFEGCLYGVGVIRGGAEARRVVRQAYQAAGPGKWTPMAVAKSIPNIGFTTLWRYYPDMAASDVASMRYEWEHHRYTKAAMIELAARKSFDAKKILSYLQSFPDGNSEQFDYEQEVRTIGYRDSTNNLDDGTYDVFERTGWLTIQSLRDLGVPGADKRRPQDVAYCNVWVLPTGEVIKAVERDPNAGRQYHLFALDLSETTVLPPGLAHIMRDDQDQINAAARMMYDNAAATCGPMLEAFSEHLAQNQGLEIAPFKVFDRIGGDPQYPVVRSIDLPSRLTELQMLYQMADANSDESTVMPRFMYAENPTQGAAGTMGGLSMLMGNVKIAIKDLVTNYDEGVTKPMISAMYHWNMKWHPDSNIKGDFDCNAIGAASLVAREIKSQMLAQFGATLQPEERPFVKFHKLVQAKASAMEVSDLVKTEDEVKSEQSDQAMQQMQQMQQKMQQLQIELLAGQVAKVQADAQLAAARSQSMINESQSKIENMMAQTQLVLGKLNETLQSAMQTRVQTAYTATQTAAVAAGMPHVAQAADGLLQASGWQDAPQAGQISGEAMLPPAGQDPATGQPVQPPADMMPPADAMAPTGMPPGMDQALPQAAPPDVPMGEQGMDTNATGLIQ